MEIILIIILQIACNVLILEIAVVKVHRDHMRESHGYDIGKPYIRYEVYKQLGWIMLGIIIGTHLISGLGKLLL